MEFGFIKWIEASPAYDKRDADPKKNYGIHGVNLRWILVGPCGAIQFVLYTNWQLPHVQAETDARTPHHSHPYMFHKPIPSDIGYHALEPQYDGQDAMSSCDILGRPCYYDGSTLNAERYFDILVESGGDALWNALEEKYMTRFGNQEPSNAQQ